MSPIASSPEGVARPVGVPPLWSVPLRGQIHPVVWTGLALTMLGLDFLTGPYVQVAILFVFPIALATWSHGRLWGSVVAVALPVSRLPFFYMVWNASRPWPLEAVDTGIDVLVLLALAWVVDYIRRQRREINVLQGMLPICGFCKRIRDESGSWLQLERYIADRSEAKFTHTFCPECGRKHYEEYLEG